jgi:hypothetical protein
VRRSSPCRSRHIARGRRYLAGTPFVPTPSPRPAARSNPDRGLPPKRRGATAGVAEHGERGCGADSHSGSVANVREIVRDAENSHGGGPPKCRLMPILSEQSGGAARGIRTPPPSLRRMCSAWVSDEPYDSPADVLPLFGTSSYSTICPPFREHVGVPHAGLQQVHRLLRLTSRRSRPPCGRALGLGLDEIDAPARPSRIPAHELPVQPR